jgi:hypothetical protein
LVSLAKSNDNEIGVALLGGPWTCARSSYWVGRVADEAEEIPMMGREPCRLNFRLRTLLVVVVFLALLTAVLIQLMRLEQEAEGTNSLKSFS